MIKKSFLTLILFIAATLFSSAQNLQLHFDPRHALHGDDFNRNYLTATFEMFKPDKWGSTFMFVDFDFNQPKGNIGLAYAEIARDQKIGKLPFAAHIEFNGGLGNAYGSGFSISNAYLLGTSYSRKVGAFNLGSYIAYKYNDFNKVSHDIQWTGIWNAKFSNDKISLSGFIDVWTENKNKFDTSATAGGKRFVLLFEPQFWYNATSNFSLGTEIEISDNFLPSGKFYINPTIAAKWNF